MERGGDVNFVCLHVIEDYFVIVPKDGHASCIALRVICNAIGTSPYFLKSCSNRVLRAFCFLKENNGRLFILNNTFQSLLLRDPICPSNIPGNYIHGESEGGLRNPSMSCTCPDSIKCPPSSFILCLLNLRPLFFSS